MKDSPARCETPLVSRMILRHTAMATAFVAIQAGLWPCGALAAERDCAGMIVRTDAGIRGHWPDSIDRIESELSGRADIDPCVHVDLRIEGNAVVTVSVTLPDGRTASRAVTERDDLIPTLQGLLLLPVPVPDPSPPAPAAALPPDPASPHRTAFIAETRRTERDELPVTTAARSLGVEISLITGARMGDGQLGIGAGALSFIELNAWLLGFEGRADSYRALAGGDAETVLELAVLAGRRFDLGSVALDLSAGPGVAIKGVSSSKDEIQHVNERTETPTEIPPPVPASDARSAPVARLLLGARLGFGPRSFFRTFVGIDGEVGPALASSDSSAARLPRYSVGVSLGATIGSP
jgi:hypothetical protein